MGAASPGSIVMGLQLVGVENFHVLYIAETYKTQALANLVMLKCGSIAAG